MTSPAPTASTAPSGLRATWTHWVDTAVRPRVLVLRLAPEAGWPLIAGVLLVDIALGLLPVGFVLATSEVIGTVPAAVAGGVDSAAWDDLVRVFLLATALFLAQQALTPVQSSLNITIKRVVDGRVTDAVLGTTLETVSIAPMEDAATLGDIDEISTAYEKDFATPGEAVGGFLALVARYLRLVGFAVVVGVVLAWWAGLAVVVATLAFRYGQRGGLRRYSQVWQDVVGVRRRSQYLRDVGMGAEAAKETRIYDLTSWVADRYEESYRTMFGAVAAMRRRVYLRPFLVIGTLGLAVAVLVLVVAARAAASGEIDLTGLALVLQSVVAAMLLGEYFVESDVATQYGMLGVAARYRLEQRVDEANRQGLAASAEALRRSGLSEPAVLPPEAPAQALRFEDVRFAYPGTDRPVLDGLDLTLVAGRSTAVVGVNGAGKTTLVKLLTRLHDQTGGRLTADGVDLMHVDPADWRRKVGVIFQDFVRFELSAADNIALGAAHVPRDDDAVREAAARAGVLDAFATLPLGLDTPLARAYEGGIDLSGGQWQRIAIARALYALHAGARVLVLDEPTSALDVRAEADFFDHFVELTQGVTSLLISHRFSSVRRADHVVVVDGGRVVEQGSHDQLMAADGHYARLFRLQAERFRAGLDAEGDLVEEEDDR